jgi:tetratricopeptide (TPR) repeat protein
MRILETCSLDKGVADTIFNMAGSVLDLGSIDLSEKLYRRALSEYNLHFDKLGKGKVLVNFARICHKKGKTKEAVDYLQTAIGIFDEFGYLYYLSIALGTLANIHLDQKQYEEALKCFDEAASISFKIGDTQGQADWTGGLGNALLLSATEYQTAERAVRCYERAIELASEIDDQVGKGKWLRNMSKAYQHMCNPVIAKELLEQAVVLLEPRLGAQSTEVINAKKDLKKLRDMKYCVRLLMGMEP